MSQSLGLESGSGTGVALNKIFDFAEKVAKSKEAHNQSAASSLVRFSSVSRVEPLCIVDSDCIQLEYISDVLASLQSIFTGYYLQAISLIGTVNGVQIAKELDRLNPSRDPKVSEFIQSTRDTFQVPYRMDLQSYKWLLPTSKNIPALEASNPPEYYKASYAKQKEFDNNEANNVGEIVKDGMRQVEGRQLQDLNEIANLSTGRLINVSIQKNNQRIEVPIAIRLLVNELRPQTLVKMFGNGAMEKTFKERYYKWKSGRIDFFNDLILCRDLIKEQKKSLMEDKEGVFTEIHSRANKNMLAGLISKQPSMATASNLYVISEATAAAIKRTSGLDITNFNQRQALFEETYAMVVAVIDRDYQRINFYHDNIRLPTRVGLTDIRHANKDAGASVMDILSAYKKGNAPSL